jgi:hypothetical protein
MINSTTRSHLVGYLYTIFAHHNFHRLGFDTVKAEDAQYMRNPSYTGNQSK